MTIPAVGILNLKSLNLKSEAIMTKKVILTFPVDATDRPLTYDLIRIYDVKVNILKAEIQQERPDPFDRDGSRSLENRTGYCFLE